MKEHKEIDKSLSNLDGVISTFNEQLKFAENQFKGLKFSFDEQESSRSSLLSDSNLLYNDLNNLNLASKDIEKELYKIYNNIRHIDKKMQNLKSL